MHVKNVYFLSNTTHPFVNPVYEPENVFTWHYIWPISSGTGCQMSMSKKHKHPGGNSEPYRLLQVSCQLKGQ